VLTDTQVGEVRVAAARSGLFCGLKLTAGDCYVLAGDGRGRPQRLQDGGVLRLPHRLRVISVATFLPFSLTHTPPTRRKCDNATTVTAVRADGIYHVPARPI
jgi:hypothetical protein